MVYRVDVVLVAILATTSIALRGRLRVSLDGRVVYSLDDLISDDTQMGAINRRQIIQIANIFVIPVTRWLWVIFDLGHAVQNILVLFILKL